MAAVRPSRGMQIRASFIFQTAYIDLNFRVKGFFSLAVIEESD
jgi:hypothetical protein